MKGYFVTGTDTGVGKTYVAAGLARRVVERGGRVFAFKPIETGCVGELGEDQEQLVRAAGSWQEGKLAGLYRFAMPVAPWVAARAAGVTIDLDEIIRSAREGGENAGLTIVEGAGGWRVPITLSEDMGHLARRLGLPIIIVARAGLGTINHSLLTIEAVERAECSVAGVVLSEQPNDDQDMAESNRDEIQRQTLCRVSILRSDFAVLDYLLTCFT